MKIAVSVFIVLVLYALPAAGETVYVIDKLLVGVHQNKDLNSAIIKVLPTGTRLEVVERDGELALITDAEGSRGWVDSAYLMSDPPAETKVRVLTEENAELSAKLAAAASGAAPTADDGAGNAEREKLMKENTELKRKLSAEKIETGKLQTKVASLEAKVADKPLTATDTIIEDLENSNQKLMRELETAMQQVTQLESELEDRPEGPSVTKTVVATPKMSGPWLGGIGAALLIAFGVGVYFMDYLNRRRHGGFRV